MEFKHDSIALWLYNNDDIQTQPSAALLSLLNRKPDHDNSIKRIFRWKKIHPKNWNSPTVKSLLFLQDLRGINILRAQNVSFIYLHRHYVDMGTI
jgi:hypothetical protein